jgi:hypothetical protein
MVRHMCLLIIANSSSSGFASVNARVCVLDLNRLYCHPKQLAMVKKGCISFNMLCEGTAYLMLCLNDVFVGARLRLRRPARAR